MERRKAMKIAAGVIAGGGAGLIALSQSLESEQQQVIQPKKLSYTPEESNWNYLCLDPAITAERSYNAYSEGSCMYATIKSIISQLGERVGEPYLSFPVEMFKYGHGGIGGYGSVCGALNGAAALIGLLVHEKKIQDQLITDLFQWYEKEAFPKFTPQTPHFDFILPTSTSNSILCHASNTNWCNASGFAVTSNERKERCRRLTGDVTHKVTTLLNEISTNTYTANTHANESAQTCLSCHGGEGKLKNTSAKMSCNSCHSESIGHQVFSDIHYRLIKE